MSHHSYSNNNQRNQSSQSSQWLHKCRNILIEMETKNITQRALSWSTIVNAETSRINIMLGLPTKSSTPQPIDEYRYIVDQPLKYLNFLSEWSGIKTRNTSTQPQTYEEFESKAKNWLNGRRAPNYGNTLFPDMIKSSEKYAKLLSSLIFGNIPINKQSHSPTSDSLCNQYQKTLIFAYLHKLCSERIAVHQSWKKTNLLCENSVKNIHSNTAKLLQQYAIHDYTDNDLNSFPGSLQRASAFFSEQHSRYLSRLMHSYNIFKQNQNNNNNQRSHDSMSFDGNNNNNRYNNNNNNNYDSMMSQSSQSSQIMVNGTNMNRPINYVAIKSSEYANIMERLAALERKHNDQANQISTLTKKCQLLQSHIDTNNASTIQSTSSHSGGAINQSYDKLSSNDEYYNDHQSQQSMNCSVQNSTAQSSSTNNGVINITSSPSISHQSHPDNNSINTRSTTTNSNHLQLPQAAQRLNQQRSVPTQSQTQQPIPFNISNNYNGSQSLPPQLSLPSFNSHSSSTVVVQTSQPNNNNDHNKLDITYNAPGPNTMPQITALSASTSMPAMYNMTNSNTTTTNSTPRSNIGGYSDYNYGGIPQQFTMNEQNNNSNQNVSSDCTMNYMTSSQPNSATNFSILPNAGSYLSDQMMLDHNNSTPNAANNMFAYSPLHYHH